MIEVYAYVCGVHLHSNCKQRHTQMVHGSLRLVSVPTVPLFASSPVKLLQRNVIYFCAAQEKCTGVDSLSMILTLNFFLSRSIVYQTCGSTNRPDYAGTYIKSENCGNVKIVCYGLARGLALLKQSIMFYACTTFCKLALLKKTIMFYACTYIYDIIHETVMQ